MISRSLSFADIMHSFYAESRYCHHCFYSALVVSVLMSLTNL